MDISQGNINAMYADLLISAGFHREPLYSENCRGGKALGWEPYRKVDFRGGRCYKWDEGYFQPLRSSVVYTCPKIFPRMEKCEKSRRKGREDFYIDHISMTIFVSYTCFTLKPILHLWKISAQCGFGNFLYWIPKWRVVSLS